MSKPINGYDNYATWKVQLEILGYIEFDEPVTVDILKKIVEDEVFIFKKELMENYARCFLSNVNYYQLERFINEELKEQYENDTGIAKLLQTTTIYIVPRLNPEAAEHFFADLKLETCSNHKPVDDGCQMKIVQTFTIFDNYYPEYHYITN